MEDVDAKVEIHEKVDLLQKALKIHPDQSFPALGELDDTNSRFRNPDWINADQ